MKSFRELNTRFIPCVSDNSKMCVTLLKPMNDQPDGKLGQVKPVQPAAGSSELPKSDAATASDAQNPDAPKKLSAEEQMAAFEDALKESDWGHQPC